jgi:hypothetical protein
MNVRARHDLFEVMVLEIAQYSFKLTLMVIVDIRNNSERWGVGLVNRFIDEFLPHEITNRFRAIGIPAAGDEKVELLEKVILHRNAEPVEIFHA